MKDICSVRCLFVALALTAVSACLAQKGQTSRVSVASDGPQGSDHSEKPSISADGRYVAFATRASNLVQGDTNGWQDIFVHDRQTGQTSRVSVASDGTQGNSVSAYPAISADGRYVAFASFASNLVQGDTNGWQDIFVHDRQTGQTSRVSVTSDGTQGNDNSLYPAISADGRYVAFVSYASNLVQGDTNGITDIFVHDRQTGQTSRVSVASNGTQGNGYSAYPVISADGRYVAFVSYASNLVQGDTNGRTDVFVHQYLDSPIRNVLPSSISVLVGLKESGGLDELLASDDMYVVVLNGAVALPTESPITIDVTYTSPSQTVTAMQVRWENRVSITGLEQRLEMRNFTTGIFDQIDRRAASKTDTVVTSDVPSPNDHIQQGTKTMLTRHRVNATGPLFTNAWRAYVDEVVVLQTE